MIAALTLADRAIVASVVFVVTSAVLAAWLRGRLFGMKRRGGLSGAKRKAALIVAVLALGGAVQVKAQDMLYDAWYKHRCIDHASDIPECFEGLAGPARAWCSGHVYGTPTKVCVQDYLANGRPPSGQYRCATADVDTDVYTLEEQAMQQEWEAMQQTWLAPGSPLRFPPPTGQPAPPTNTPR